MRVSFSTSNLACQPLKFGKAEKSNKNNPTPAFTSSVSREEYDKLNAKYQLACRLAVAQAEQYKKYVAAHPAK